MRYFKFDPDIGWIILLLVLFVQPVMAEDFAYELTASGTESPDVTFSVELIAEGKETVIESVPYSRDDIEEEFNASWIQENFDTCEYINNGKNACLPDNCEIDKSQGNGKGYTITNISSVNVEKENYWFEGQCLKYSVEICDPGIDLDIDDLEIHLDLGYEDIGKYHKLHTVHGKCTIPGNDWKNTQKKGPFSIDIFPK